MKEEQLKAKSNAILDKLEEDGFDLDDWSIEDAHNNGFIDGYHECQKEHEWHYPSKGELPTHDCMVLLHWESAIGSNTVITCWKKGKFLQPYNRKDITVAWHEIIPPKENE